MPSKASLAIALSKLSAFSSPKLALEQYTTDSETASGIIWQAYMLGDIEGKKILDAGCGCATLGIGALMLGADHVDFLDIDNAALRAAKDNIIKAEKEYGSAWSYNLVQKDISGLTAKPAKAAYDTIIQNPPFGANDKHADRRFLSFAAKTDAVIYSVHNENSMDFLKAFAKDNSLAISHRWKYELPLKKSYSHHTRRIHRISVICVRLTRL